MLLLSRNFSTAIFVQSVSANVNGFAFRRIRN